VNPANPREIVTGFQTGRDDAGGGIDNGFTTSHDGGATYTSGAMPGLTATSPSPTAAYTRASDAVVTWGLGETVYYSSLVFRPQRGESGVGHRQQHQPRRRPALGPAGHRAGRQRRRPER